MHEQVPWQHEETRAVWGRVREEARRAAMTGEA